MAAVIRNYGKTFVSALVMTRAKLMIFLPRSVLLPCPPRKASQLSLMAQGFSYRDYLKVRIHLPRYSLCTRILVLSTILIWIAGYFFSWIRDWGVLVPSQISWSSRERNRDWNVNNYTEALITLAVHRLTTYPFINLGSFRFLCSLLALAPLLDRFELEYGTITTLALFTGRTLIDR